jgi:hypothetical protein
VKYHLYSHESSEETDGRGVIVHGTACKRLRRVAVGAEANQQSHGWQSLTGQPLKQIKHEYRLRTIGASQAGRPSENYLYTRNLYGVHIGYTGNIRGARRGVSQVKSAGLDPYALEPLAGAF